MADMLYLGSQSQTRQLLLKEARIPFTVLLHKSDEGMVYKDDDFYGHVKEIAEHKMELLVLPSADALKDISKGIFVLTADTLVRTTETNEILGKPKDRKDAERMLQLECEQLVEVVTGCCLERKEYIAGEWQTKEQELWAMGAEISFCVPTECRDRYFKESPFALYCAGSATIEGPGMMFSRSVNGCYYSVLGLPMFELRERLVKIGYKF
jgi:septum formation protein